MLGHLDPQPEPAPLGMRQQPDHDLEPRGLDAGGQGPVHGVRQVVDGGEVDAHVEAVDVQGPHDVHPLLAGGVQHLLAPRPGHRRVVHELDRRGRGAAVVLGRLVGRGLGHRQRLPRATGVAV